MHKQFSFCPRYLRLSFRLVVFIFIFLFYLFYIFYFIIFPTKILLTALVFFLFSLVPVWRRNRFLIYRWCWSLSFYVERGHVCVWMEHRITMGPPPRWIRVWKGFWLKVHGRTARQAVAVGIICNLYFLVNKIENLESTRA